MATLTKVALIYINMGTAVKFRINAMIAALEWDKFYETNTAPHATTY